MDLNGLDYKLLQKSKGFDWVSDAVIVKTNIVNHSVYVTRYIHYLIEDNKEKYITEKLLDCMMEYSFSYDFLTLFRKLLSYGIDIEQKKYVKLLTELLDENDNKVASMLFYLILGGNEIPKIIKDFFVKSSYRDHYALVTLNKLFKHNIKVIPEFIIESIKTNLEMVEEALDISLEYDYKEFIDLFLKEIVSVYEKIVEYVIKKSKFTYTEYKEMSVLKKTTRLLFKNDSERNPIFLKFIGSKQFKKYFEMYKNDYIKEYDIMTASDNVFIEDLEEMKHILPSDSNTLKEESFRFKYFFNR